MESSFYVHVTSGASILSYPDNTLSSFRTHLPHPLIFNDSNWYCAVTDVHYTNSWPNLADKANVKLTLYYNQRGIRTHIFNKRVYSNNSELLNELKVAFDKEKEYITFNFKKGKRLHFTIKGEETMLKMTPQSASLLGFLFVKSALYEFREGQHKASVSPRLHRYCTPVIDLTCNAVKQNIIAGSYKSWLRSIPVPNSNHGELQSVSFNNPYYIPVSQNFFDSLECKLCDQRGHKIKFEWGTPVQLTLHFRQDLPREEFFLVLREYRYMNGTYTYHLPHELNLGGDYVVGLGDITYMRLWKNISENSVSVIDNASQRGFTRSIYPGYYKTAKDLVDAIFSLEEIKRFVSGMSVEPVYNRFVCKLKNSRMEIRFSARLAVLLGWIEHNLEEDLVLKEVNIVSPHRIDPTRLDSRLMYIYTNLVSPTIVGDVYSSILRILPLKDNIMETSHHSFNPLQYLPVSKNHFEDITLKIKDEAGNNISLVHNNSLSITLHFKKQ